MVQNFFSTFELNGIIYLIIIHLTVFESYHKCLSLNVYAKNKSHDYEGVYLLCHTYEGMSNL